MMNPISEFLSPLLYPLSLYAGTLILLVILLLVGLRLLVCYTIGECKSNARLDGKVVIITGSDTGMGKETAKDLAQRNAKVIMASLNVNNAIKVREELVKSTGNQNIVVKKLDLTSQSSIREFAEQINREETRLDVLIHNAGTAGFLNKEKTEDGLELIMATNHYGPFLLTHLLIDLLKKSAPSRIVVVSSLTYILCRLNLVKNPNPTSTFPSYLYCVSKYANILFTKESARRLKGSGVTVNCLHPGIMWTEIWNCVPLPYFWIIKLLLLILSRTPEQGAQTSIHLAVSDEVAEVSGKYFADCKEQSLIGNWKDEAKGKKFWELSEDLVKLKPTDPKI